jgi:hypothetical protein
MTVARTATGFTVSSSTGAVILEVETLQGARVAFAIVPGLSVRLGCQLIKAGRVALKDLLRLRHKGNGGEDGVPGGGQGGDRVHRSSPEGGPLGERPP